MLDLVWRPLVTAATRRPGARDWAEAAALLAGFALIAAAAGLGTGLIAPRLDADPAALARVALAAVLVPALGEEAVFRGPLARGRYPLAALSLALFVAWHPAQLALGLPWARPVFADPAFLALAGLLGLACTVSRMRSGSLWPAVAMHWIAVVAWKALGAI
jgi:predicted Abi (CAAX) family protease